MPPTFFLKPATEGLIVRDPLTRKPLASEGEQKPMTKYWGAREAEGSVVRTDPSEKSDPSERSDKPRRTTATTGGEQ